jgi:hypothetical protein
MRQDSERERQTVETSGHAVHLSAVGGLLSSALRHPRKSAEQAFGFAITRCAETASFARGVATGKPRPRNSGPCALARDLALGPWRIAAVSIERVVRDISGSGPTGSASVELSSEETERTRLRVRLMVEISARAGGYRRGLVKAAEHLTPEEAAVLADLETHGLDVKQLQDVLHGAHVLIDEPSLYERWLFPTVSTQRLSSHHPDIDKKKYPDIGMKGPLLREKLHGRTTRGTWVQLEKTPTAMGQRKYPSPEDISHLVDYVVYRVTRSNVGPWGRSGSTERRPMYLSPDLGARVALPSAASDELIGVVSRIGIEDDVTSASPELAARFAPPRRANDLVELTFTGDVQGRGLFGGSDVWIVKTAALTARELLRDRRNPPAVSPPAAGSNRPAKIELDHGHGICYAVRTIQPPQPAGASG